MFISETLLWLAEHGWLMFLHWSARSSFPQPLPAEEEQRLIARLTEGDGEAKRRLIEHNLRLVAHIAKKYARNGLEQDDLVSVGAIGLMKAVQTFKPEAGRLSAYASRCIENEILMVIRADRKNRSVVCMGDCVGTDKDGNELSLADLVGTDPDLVPNEAETAIESGRAVALMKQVLLPREVQVLEMRFGLKDGDPQPQHAVAKRLGISRSYVSRIEKKALEKLRRAMEKVE